MAVVKALEFVRSSRTPVVLQTEAAECGLACLAMVAGGHGLDTDLATLRRRHAVSLKGTTLAELMRIATTLKLSPRAVKVDLEALAHLTLPAVLHWDFNHFVVLSEIRGKKLAILDPARGRRLMRLDEVSEHFTGVALEFSPATGFERRRDRSRVKLSELVGRLPGAARVVAQVLLLTAALEVFVLAAPFYLQWVVDDVLVSEDRDLLTVLALGFALLALLQVTITALRSWVVMVLGMTLNAQLVVNLFRHLLRLPMSFFAKRHLGDVVSRFESLSEIQRTLTTSFIEAVVDGLMAVLTFTMMYIYSPALAGVVLVVALIYGAVRFALYRPLRQAREEQILRGAKEKSHFLETVRGMQSVKVYNRQGHRRSVYHNLLVDTFNAKIAVERLNIGFHGVNGALFSIENVLVVWLAATLILDGSFSIGMLFAFMAYKAQFITRITDVIEKGVDMRMLGLHLERVSDVALCPPEDGGEDGGEEGGEDGQAKAASAPAEAPTLELRGVSFRYAESEPWVLDNVDLRIEPGESVAIVGPSGCGKSTLLKLMLGLLQPTRGEVLVDGTPLGRYGAHRYRAIVGAVMQDDQLFAGSIADNISFFDEPADQATVEACARVAAVDQDIASMPMGYRTLIGDMGTVLSGGQKQRVLLARALYRGPSVLLLDEATSHLDVTRERQVNAAIRELDVTRVIIAHRPETIASADRVVVLGRAGEGAPSSAGAGEAPGLGALSYA